MFFLFWETSGNTKKLKAALKSQMETLCRMSLNTAEKKRLLLKKIYITMNSS